MWNISGDPLRDAEAYDGDQQEGLDRLPVCAYCGAPIQDEFSYEINGELICKECLNANHRHFTENFID